MFKKRLSKRFKEAGDTSCGQNRFTKRVVLKLSGEALAGELGYGIEQDMLNFVAGEVQAPP